MNFEELVKAVINVTNRPDLVAETIEAIKRSTIKMHTVDFFPRDLQQITYPVNAAQGQISLEGFTRLRKILKIIGHTSSGRFYDLKPLSFSDVQTFGGATKLGYFQAGSAISFRAFEKLNTLTIAAYVLPDTSKENYNSWIAELYPYAIIDDAAASIMMDLGNTTAAQALLSRVGTKNSDNMSAHIPTILAEQLYAHEIEAI